MKRKMTAMIREARRREEEEADDELERRQTIKLEKKLE